MRIRKFDRVDEIVYSEVLPNGLSVYVIPKSGFKSSFAAFAADYGGSFVRFEIDGEFIDTPAGVAHYLEHKMFDMPDGDNALATLSQNGADPNAFTSSGMTCYHFSSTENFEENLRMLLKFVSTPYFTPETVQKEQGIIGQEIRMTEDNPGYAVYKNLLRLLYAQHPIRNGVVGTVESIAEITDKTLYDCHKVFYNPSNMCLCVEGDVDPERIIAIAQEVLPKEKGSKPHADFGKEDEGEPEVKYVEVEMEVSAPQFLIGARVTPAQNGKELMRQKLVGQLALRLLCGRASQFYTGLYDEGLLSRDYGYETDYTAGIATTMVEGESRDPGRVLDELKAQAQCVIDSGFDADAFERAKRASYGARLRALEDFGGVCVSVAECSFEDYDAFDTFEALEGVSKSECEDFVKTYLRPEYFVMSVVKPGKA